MNRSWISVAVAAVVLAVAAPSAHAQGGGPPPGGMRGGGARMMENLFKDITLDDAQKVKIEAIRVKYQKEMPAMTPGERPSADDMAKRREIMMKQQDEMRGVLTAEQQKTFDKNIADMRARMGRGPGS